MYRFHRPFTHIQRAAWSWLAICCTDDMVAQRNIGVLLRADFKGSAKQFDVHKGAKEISEISLLLSITKVNG